MASNNRGLTIERQSSDFALGDGGRQESVLEPGFVRAPKDMKPPTPMQWNRGDSLMWEQNAADVDKSTPLAGYGRDKDPFADAVASISPTDERGRFPDTQASAQPPAAAQQLRAGTSSERRLEQGMSFAAALLGRHPGSNASSPAAQQQQQQQQPGAPDPMQLTVTEEHDEPPFHQPQSQNQRGGNRQSSVQFHPQATAGGNGAGGARRREEGGQLRRQTTSEAQLAAQFRSESQIMTDELHFQAKHFPPPPPIAAPSDSRRERAERWYYYAMKWDITHEQPPPPRSPLPLMDQEKANPTMRDQFPYRGDYWLGRCQHWFEHLQNHFPYPHATAHNKRVRGTDWAVVDQMAQLDARALAA